MAAIALLTDFGASEYPGVVKGVLSNGAPRAQLIDLCHSITPYSVREGAWVLLKCSRFFPKGTVFLAVVDPGVGTARRALAVKTRNCIFVGPDNGLLWPAASADGIVEARALDVPAGASRTFHARDVFAPAAARLAANPASFGRIGNKVSSIERLEFHLKGREGEVVRVDPFGNVVTNIPPLVGRGSYELRTGGKGVRLRFHETYARAPLGEPFILVGSEGTLELAVREGSAAKALGLRPGQRVALR